MNEGYVNLTQNADSEAIEPDWLNEPCPGGFAWDCCSADDCGVADDGTGCRYHLSQIDSSGTP
ncbi:MAG TPA: hypothetical protein VLL25_17420 [Acidimicrobiales bacterium]|nr:hypothetical protein [Acidimicrobiales bacterium]